MIDGLLPALDPPALRPTWSGRDPAAAVERRAASLPGIVALPVRSIDPELPQTIWSADPAWGSTAADEVRARTLASVRATDWGRIGVGSTVDLIANPHGFFLCGDAYVAMLEETQRHLQQERHCTVRLRIAESMGHIENPDWMRIYDLPGRFGDAKECPQIGRGTRVDTELGTFWLTRDLFTADHFVHTHVAEMREGYLHRMIDRLHKPFGMGYTRLETRSAYHFSWGPRTGQLVARAVFESEFVQQRYAGTVVLDTTPEGVIGVESAVDLDELNGRITRNVLRHYGTFMRLLAEIDDVVVVFDGPGCHMYSYGGGVAFDCLMYAQVDFLDLDNLALLKGFASHLPEAPGLTMEFNPAIKAQVMNYMAGGVPYTMMTRRVPTYLVDGPAAHWLIEDPCSPWLGDRAEVVPDLEGAVAIACERAGTSNVVVFDSTPGALHVSESLGRLLIERAPSVRHGVLHDNLPRWLAQRHLAEPSADGSAC
jgi:hypothetical protein